MCIRDSIIAEACWLNVLEVTEAPGMDIRLDIPAEFNRKQLLAVALGIEKGDKDIQDKQHCVLIVEPMSKLDVAGREQCKRVGAGVVIGKYFSEKRKTCSII